MCCKPERNAPFALVEKGMTANYCSCLFRSLCFASFHNLLSYQPISKQGPVDSAAPF